MKILRLCEENNIEPIPIIGCTGFSSKEVIQELKLAGMKQVIIKPVTKNMINTCLENLD